ncbi:LPS export ABC transporter periplasmic protein LptC [Hippea alviniae]|uniref:LPS export ABC transporter periplasmic protein LptC n=1 Tax=Hippea alviniae TaxID=1279027 RepID=UPI0003B5B921|nr:LPS export ABC transporter periplasmic protein LptC [Hippea alviniae]
MISFKKLTLLVGYLAFFLFFGVLAFLFLGFVQREVAPQQKVRFEVKEKAKGVDLWRVANNKRYHLIAADMIKRKDGVIELFKPNLWIIEKNKPDVYIKSDKAYVYPNNSVLAKGNVYLKREDLNIKGSDVFYNSKDSTLSSKNAFNGFNKKSKFKGESFVYLINSDILKAKRVDIWLK